MNQIATRENSINSVTVASGTNGSSIAPQNLGEVVRFAEVMCKADIAIPKHLRGNAGACMAVAMQALEWQMSPFAVASKSYSVNGAIAYEAQLIAAVVNTRSGIKGRLKYHFEGTGDAMTCTVIGVLDGEECEYTSPPIGKIPVKNSPLWKSDPQQQLGYYSARSWARRHCPEVLLGVYDRDEAEQFQGADNAKDVTPSVMERLQQRNNDPQVHEGFNKDFVTTEVETLADTTGNETQDMHVGTNSTGNAEGVDQLVDNDHTLTQNNKITVDRLSNEERKELKKLIKLLHASVGPDQKVLINTAVGFNDMGTLHSDLAKAKAKSITQHFLDACKGKLENYEALEIACGVASIDVAELDVVLP